MKKNITVFLLTITLFTQLASAQYSPKSPYLQNPDLILGYVDSCAEFWDTALDPSATGGFFTNIDRQGNVLTA